MYLRLIIAHSGVFQTDCLSFLRLPEVDVKRRLQFVHLIWFGHFDSRVAEKFREASHRLFFAVNKECAFRTGLLLPSQ